MATLKPLIITFNCARELVKPDVFARHIVKSLEHSERPDIVVFSLQEFAPISYAFLGGSFLAPYYRRLRQTTDLLSKQWSDGSYLNVLAKNIGMTSLIIFVNEEIMDSTRLVETAAVGVGLLEMGNKGAIGAVLEISGPDTRRRMTFVSAHLAPMEDALERRNLDWINIVKRLIFEPISQQDTVKTSQEASEPENTYAAEPLLSYKESGLYTQISHVFVAGDLNYRTSSRSPTPEDLHLFPRPGDGEFDLLKDDQLSSEMRVARTMQGYIEAPINFIPTYKYSNKARSRASTNEAENTTSLSHATEHSYEWAQHRWPSWCDRILYLDTSSWMNATPASVPKPHIYSSLPLMSTSDHRPVLLLTSVPLGITAADRSSIDDDVVVKSPYSMDPHWRRRRAAARRREIVVGILAYLATTWEGSGVVLATILGIAGLWALTRSLFT